MFFYVRFKYNEIRALLVEILALADQSDDSIARQRDYT